MPADFEEGSADLAISHLRVEPAAEGTRDTQRREVMVVLVVL
jgi:hypothetical protein